METSSQTIRIFRKEAPVSVLGPGQRAVVWVQGCSFGCKGCIVPESWDSGGGEAEPISELAEWILTRNDICGVTYSGGEPMQQAEELCELTKAIRSRADLGVVCYTGYRHEFLVSQGTQAQQELLGYIDILIDGVYRQDLHANLLWRGSSNQRLLALTPRYRAMIQGIDEQADRSAGIEFFVDADGIPAFAGVPHVPNFREQFTQGMEQHGVMLNGMPTVDADRKEAIP